MSERFDSGYTPEELDAIFESMAKGTEFAWPEESIALALAIGLSDGDLVGLSERGTVMLATPRTTLDRLVAEIKTRMANGESLREAVDAVVT